MPLIEVNVQGVNCIETELNRESAKIVENAEKALKAIGDEMISNLQTHIEEEWYKPYTPKAYKRRTDDSSYGTPLGAQDYMKYSVNGLSLTFGYNPSGLHTVKKWHTRDSDELIESIQTAKLKGNPPPRPFWNSFLFEQGNGAIMKTLSDNMLPEYVIIPEDVDLAGLQAESQLNSTDQIYHIYGVYDENDPDLPM